MLCPRRQLLMLRFSLHFCKMQFVTKKPNKRVAFALSRFCTQNRRLQKGERNCNLSPFCGFFGYFLQLLAKSIKKTIYFLSFGFLFLNILLLNKITFSIAKNNTKIISVRTGFVIARVAKNIIGKPNTIAGKFW